MLQILKAIFKENSALAVMIHLLFGICNVKEDIARLSLCNFVHWLCSLPQAARTEDNVLYFSLSVLPRLQPIVKKQSGRFAKK